MSDTIKLYRGIRERPDFLSKEESSKNNKELMELERLYQDSCREYRKKQRGYAKSKMATERWAKFVELEKKFYELRDILLSGRGEEKSVYGDTLQDKINYFNHLTDEYEVFDREYRVILDQYSKKNGGMDKYVEKKIGKDKIKRRGELSWLNSGQTFTDQKTVAMAAAGEGGYVIKLTVPFREAARHISGSGAVMPTVDGERTHTTVFLFTKNEIVEKQDEWHLDVMEAKYMEKEITGEGYFGVSRK